MFPLQKLTSVKAIIALFYCPIIIWTVHRHSSFVTQVPLSYRETGHWDQKWHCFSFNVQISIPFRLQYQSLSKFSFSISRRVIGTRNGTVFLLMCKFQYLSDYCINHLANFLSLSVDGSFFSCRQSCS